jgi:hypothetical protein
MHVHYERIVKRRGTNHIIEETEPSREFQMNQGIAPKIANPTELELAPGFFSATLMKSS